MVSSRRVHYRRFHCITILMVPIIMFTIERGSTVVKVACLILIQQCKF
jgi:hypothetical protein